jgi:hypothetical protein
LATAPKAGAGDSPGKPGTPGSSTAGPPSPPPTNVPDTAPPTSAEPQRSIDELGTSTQRRRGRSGAWHRRRGHAADPLQQGRQAQQAQQGRQGRIRWSLQLRRLDARAPGQWSEGAHSRCQDPRLGLCGGSGNPGTWSAADHKDLVAHGHVGRPGVHGWMDPDDPGPPILERDGWKLGSCRGTRPRRRSRGGRRAQLPGDRRHRRCTRDRVQPDCRRAAHVTTSAHSPSWSTTATVGAAKARSQSVTGMATPKAFRAPPGLSGCCRTTNTRSLAAKRTGQ